MLSHLIPKKYDELHMFFVNGYPQINKTFLNKVVSFNNCLPYDLIVKKIVYRLYLAYHYTIDFSYILVKVTWNNCLFSQITCQHVFSSLFWCLRNNDVRFVCLYAHLFCSGWCFIYVSFMFLHIMVSIDKGNNKITELRTI